jgi:CheY-like chemotaxis protein
MPIVDGLASTALIRARERAHPQPSRIVQTQGHVPIFAVSGALRRGATSQYVAAGLDGCMPKPVDVARLSYCLAGALDENSRRGARYDGEKFESGGWF